MLHAFDEALYIAWEEFGNRVAFGIYDPLLWAKTDQLIGFKFYRHLGRHFLRKQIETLTSDRASNRAKQHNRT
ncbi:Uncharacterised protein [Vibrio cholerae]|uniref:Uncharacterized protein n=1 Tax=Vibrio cholerae TaxID=666 RepID=A0A655U974_VIBCL|nr:Uncharacterised protein [Vibrio cholerae]CSD17982.1 Uncharacterised protein [Vibrio cholerae]